jgi:exosortase/archaeosortase family protein
LFVGEFFRVGLAARFGLMVLAVGTALLGNLLRTLFLAMVASSRGLKSVDVWHDPAGMTILVLVILVLWITASKLAPAQPQSTASAEPGDFAAGVILLRRFVVGVGCFWLLAVIATELWFRQHERDWKPGPEWSVRIPSTIRNARHVEIPHTVSEQLRYDEGVSGSWVDGEGLRWQFFYLRWKPSFLFPSEATFGHRPESCLAGMGMTLESQVSARVFEKAGIELSLKAYCFRDRELPVYVFYALVEDHERSDAQKAVPNDGSYRNRWQAVTHGKRNRGQRVVELAVWGASTIEEAEKGLREFLDHALVVEGAGPVGDSRYTHQP